MATTLITAPTETPITLQEAKDHLRVTDHSEDWRINSLLNAAVEAAQDYTWRKFITQTWDYYFPFFTSTIILPFGKVQSVTTVKYYDVNNTQQTASSALYLVDTNMYEGQISLVTNQTWPSVYDRPNPIVIRYVCGYGSESAVPEMIKHAIKIKLEILYANLYPNEVQALESTYTNLLNPYRIKKFC